MVVTLHLILAHFLADFPFQPRMLVHYKQRHFLGVIIHSLTHLITSAVLLFPYLRQAEVWVAIGFIFLVHNVVDKAKISLQNANPKWNKWWLYIADQIAHLAAIWLVSVYYLGPLGHSYPVESLRLYHDKSIILYILILTLTTYFYDVSRWTYRNNKKPFDYRRDYGMMVRNAVIVTVAFGLYWVTR